MSYPKKHPVVQMSERDQKQQQRKEQMKTLLINKFRSKYSITADNEQSDKIIRQEVESFLASEQLTEQNLLKLDKKINDIFGGRSQYNGSAQHKKQKSIVATLQRDGNQTQPLRQSLGAVDYRDNNYDYLNATVSSHQSKRSEYSRQSVGAASNRSRSNVIKDAGNQILQAPAAQSDDYWNKIIMFNVESYHKEQEEAKQRAKDNQVRMKEELEKQIHAQRKIKEEERRKEQQYAEQIAQIGEEQSRKEKQKQDEMKRKLQMEKQVRDLQLQEISLKKTEETKIEKMEEEERRRKIERDAKDQQLKEKEKIKQYKEQCQKQYVENLAFKEIKKKQEEEQNAYPSSYDNMLGQLFIEKKHISYEKRAQNDRKVELIKDKIVGDQFRREQQIERSIDQVQKERERLEKLKDEQKKREIKAKEAETKKYLDLQIQEKQQKNYLDKTTDQQEAVYINKDVREFENYEKNKKENYLNNMKAHKESLEKQMQNSKTKNTTMAQQEYMLNKKILDTIESKTQNSPQQVLPKKPF